jgi:hypothetical protein
VRSWNAVPTGKEASKDEIYSVAIDYTRRSGVIAAIAVVAVTGRPGQNIQPRITRMDADQILEYEFQRVVMLKKVIVPIWYNRCYTLAMKTAVSLPDDLFRMAEAAARKLRMSRSQLYATAIAEFLERRKTSKITERLNKVYSKEQSALDPAWHSAQLRSLAREDW